MTRALVAAALLLGIACGGTATLPQSGPPAAVTAPAGGRIDAADLMRVVRELASPRYEGRRTGTPGGRLARAFLRNELKAIGLEPAGTQGYDQPFRFAGHDDAANLVGRVRGTDPAATAIVLTAHYDHNGIRDGQMYPGADDNASGVAALLAIARYVRAHPLRHTLVVAALDAEERGLEGAQAFVARPPVPRAQIALDVNLDMVSRNDRNEIYAAGAHHYPWLRPVLEDVGRRAAVTLLFGHDRPKGAPADPDDWTLQSDHGVFHKAGIPFVYFGVEDHPDYHKPTDTADRIDPKFFGNAVEMILDAVLALDRAVDRQAASPGVGAGAPHADPTARPTGTSAQ
jgi:hypothetical protein